VALVCLCGLSAGAHLDTADVQFFHAVAGAPNIDVYFDGTLVVSDLPFGEATGYLQVAYESPSVEIRATGATTALLEGTVSSSIEGGFSTIAVVGSVSNLEEYPLELFVLSDDSFPPTTRSELRVVNLVPGSAVLQLEANGQPIFAGGYSPDAASSGDVYTELTPFTPYRVVLRQVNTGSVVAGPTIVDLAVGSANTLYIIGTVDGDFPFVALELVQDFVAGQTSNSVSPTGSVSRSRTASRSFSSTPSVTPTRSFNTTASPSPTISFSRSLSALPTRTPFRTYPIEDDDDGGFTRAPSPSALIRRSATIVRTRNPSPLVEPPYDYLTSDELYLDDEDVFISPSPLPRPSPFLSRTIRFVTASDDSTLTLVVGGDDADSSSVTLSLSLALTFVMALIVFLH